MSEKASSTKEVLEFIGDRMDSIAPVLKGAVKGVSENVGHYGKEWVLYRATEWVGILATDMLLCFVFAILVFVAVVLLFNSHKMSKNDPEFDERPGFYIFLIGGVLLALISACSFGVNLSNLSNHIPKAIAAYRHPEGFAVQLLIDGVTK